MISFWTLLAQIIFLNVTRNNVELHEIIALISIVSFVPALILDMSSNKKLKPSSAPIVSGYILRAIIVVFDIYGNSIYRLPNSGADSNMYYRTACEFIQTGQTSRGGVFSLIFGVLFKFTGPSKLYGQFIISLFSVVSLIALAYILEEIEEDFQYKNLIMWIVSILPSVAIISSIFLRESIVTMFLSISCLFFIKWIKNSSWRYYILAVIFSLCAAVFHSGSIAITVGYAVILVLYDWRIHKYQFNVKSIGISVLILIAFFVLYTRFFDVFFAKMHNISSIKDIGSTSNAGGSSYARYVGDSSSIPRMIIFTVPRMLYFLFSPFLWQWRNVSDVIASAFNALFYLYVCVTGIKYLRDRNGKNYNIVIALFIIVFCAVFVFGWGCTNAGTACRHRDKLVIIFAALWGASRRKIEYSK